MDKKVSIRAKCCQGIRVLKDLTLRRHPSKIYAQVWQDYEKILMYRSMMSQFSRIIHTILFTSIGRIHW